MAVAAASVAAAGLLAGCAHYEPFDSAAYLRQKYAEGIGERAAEIEVPFELDATLKSVVAEQLKLSPDEERRAEQVEEFIFNRLGLQYALTPTRNAVGTFHAREGNCLSFTNLFIGIARELRLNPFYVEVTDHNRWNYRDGMVVSQGHIVAGMRVEGVLHTYDFLPYRPKAYKEFAPIDDLAAAAHYYNNLGAEALLAGDTERALELIDIASRIDPEFVKAINNRGVCLSRLGRYEEALASYNEGLALEPDNVALLTNSVRAYQGMGRLVQAEEMLKQIDGVQNTNPFFYVYRGEQALADGHTEAALSYMKEALSRDTELPEVHLGLTKVYLALGEVRKAKHHLSRALRLDGTNQEALQLAELLSR